MSSMALSGGYELPRLEMSPRIVNAFRSQKYEKFPLCAHVTEVQREMGVGTRRLWQASVLISCCSYNPLPTARGLE